MSMKAAELFVKIGADTDELERGLRGASSKLDDFGSGLLGKGAALSAVFTAPFLGLGTAVADATIDYQSSMGTFEAVTRASADEMARVGELAKQLGSDMSLPGTSAGDAAKAMAELAKAGLSVEQSMDAARGVLQLSAAAQIDNAKAAEIAANALNAFRLPGEKAGDVANLLAAAANSSSIEVKDAADSFKMASAVFAAFQSPASSAEDAMIDLTTAIGLLGNMGIKGSDAGTSLKQALLQLTGPSDQAKRQMQALYYAAMDASISQELLDKAMHGTAAQSQRALAAMSDLVGANREVTLATGETITMVNQGGDIAYDASGKMRPLKEIIDLVAKATANMSEEQRNYAITQIFGADASRAVIALMREGSEGWDNMREAVTRAGAAEDLAAVKMRGLGGAIEGLKSQAETTFLRIGEVVAPFLETVVRGFAELVGKLGDLPAPVIAASVAFAAVLAVVGPLMLAVGGIAIALGALAGPVGAVVLALAGLAAAVAAGAALYNENFLGIKDITEEVGRAIGTILGPVVEWFGKQMRQMADWVGEVWPLIAKLITDKLAVIKLAVEAALTAIRKFWDDHGDRITAIVKSVWKIVSTVIEQALDGVQTAIKAALQILNGDWAGAWDTIRDYLGRSWERMKTLVSEALNALKESLFLALELWLGKWDAVWQAVAKAGEDVWNGIKDFLGGIWDGLKTKATEIWNGIAEFLKTTGDRIGQNVNDAWNGIQSAIEAVLGADDNSGLRGGIKRAWVGIQTVVNYILGADDDSGLRGMVKTAWTAIKSVVEAVLGLTSGEGLWKAVKGAWEGIQSAVASVLGDSDTTGLRGIVTNAWQAIQRTVTTILGAAADSGLWRIVTAAWTGIATAVQSAIGSDDNNGLRGHVARGMAAIKSAVDAVMSGPQSIVVAIQNGLKAVADAGGNVVTSLRTGIQNKLAEFLTWIGDNLVKPIPDVVKRLLNIHSPSGVFEEIGGNIIAGLVKGLRERLPDLQGMLSNITGAVGGMFGGSGASGSVDGWLREAMQLTGVGDDWLRGLNWLVAHESTGNPNARNPEPVVVNGVNYGHASGLLQTLPSTFAAHALGGMTDIWNPVHNAAAAIRYIQRTYGHVNSIPGLFREPWQGYAEGGVIPEPVLGLGLRSGRGYTFAEYGPETVVPGVRRPGGGTTEIHYHLNVTTSEAKVDEQQLIRLLKRMELARA